MELTININAPELAHALETLAIAVGCACDKLSGGQLGTDIKEAAKTAVNEPINVTAPAIPVQMPPIAPVVNQPSAAPAQTYQQIPLQQMPAQQPTYVQPYQQAPVQQMPTNTVPAQPQPQMPQQLVATVPVQEQGYTADQLAVAATSLMDAGKRQDLVNLLGQFGIQALTALPKEQYGAFATILRGMGAKI